MSLIMEKASMQQFCYKLCSFLPTILVLVLFSFFLISESSLSLLTTLVALFSTMFLVKLTRKKGSLAENLFQDNLKKLESQPLLLEEDDDDDVNHTEVTKGSYETAKRHEQQGEEAQIDSSFPSDSEERFKFSIMDENPELNDAIADPHSDSSALPSDSETSTTGSIKSQGFQNDHITNQNLGISDILIYDDTDYDDDDEEEEEDSLIEIKLPNSNFFGSDDDEEEEHEQKLKCNNFPEFLPESILKHKGLMELLEEINEMNEDENLIEIDLSIGSTKCQDFRVKKELAYHGDQCVHSD